MNFDNFSLQRYFHVFATLFCSSIYLRRGEIDFQRACLFNPVLLKKFYSSDSILKKTDNDNFSQDYSFWYHRLTYLLKGVDHLIWLLTLIIFQLMSCSSGGKAACGSNPSCHGGYLKKKGKSLTYCRYSLSQCCSSIFYLILHHNQCKYLDFESS